MIRRLAIALLSMALAGAAQAQQSPSRVRATLAARGDVYAGQRVTLVVELLTPGYFASAATFDLPRVSGVLLLPPAERPVVGSETIDGVDFTSQRHELSVIAWRGGAYDIPPFEVRFAMKASPLDKQSQPQSVRMPPLHFVVISPPGAENPGTIISSDDLRFEETWQPALTAAKPGNAFTRTIAIRAENCPAMALPSVSIPDIDGLAIYASEPEVSDQSDRGVSAGIRRQKFTYVCQRPGRFTIPPMRLTWWSLRDKSLRTAELRGQTIDVAGPAAAQTSAATSHLPTGSIAAIVAMAMSIVWIECRWRPVRRFLSLFSPVRLVPLNPGVASPSLAGAP